MQVVTPENITQFVETGKVDEFKPPEAVKVEGKAATPPQGQDGKFVSPDTVLDTPTEKSDKTSADAAEKAKEAKAEATEKKADDPPAAGDSDDDEDLPEKVRKKIGAKHRAMREAEEFAEQEFNKRKAAERRAVELEQELAQARKSRPDQDGKPESQDLVEPKPEDFKTVAEYARAVIKHEKALDAQADAKKATETSVQTERERLGAAFKKQEAEVIVANPDYLAVVAKFDPTDLPNHIAQYLIESGPLLTYQLAKLPFVERNRITQLSPIRAIAELGKLEAKFEKPAAKQESETKQPAVSRAPSPITPLGGDGTVPVHKDPADMNFQELREFERQKQAEKRARR